MLGLDKWTVAFEFQGTDLVSLMQCFVPDIFYTRIVRIAGL